MIKECFVVCKRENIQQIIDFLTEIKDNGKETDVYFMSMLNDSSHKMFIGQLMLKNDSPKFSPHNYLELQTNATPNLSVEEMCTIIWG